MRLVGVDSTVSMSDGYRKEGVQVDNSSGWVDKSYLIFVDSGRAAGELMGHQQLALSF